MTGGGGATAELRTVPEPETISRCSLVWAEPVTSAATPVRSACGWGVTIVRAAGGRAGAESTDGSPPGLVQLVTTVSTTAAITAVAAARVSFMCSPWAVLYSPG